MPMMRSTGWKVALAVAGLLVVSSVVAIVWLARVRADQAASLTRIETENRRLRDRAAELERAAGALRQGLPVPHEEPRAEGPADVKGLSVKSVEQAKLLIQFREQMTAANKTVEALQGKLQELQYALEKLTEENKRLAASETELKEKVAVSGRVFDAVQNELKGKENRLAELDTANRRLREENRAGADKIAQLPRTLQELDQINRRREGYLTNILRRFRDMTDQYRAAASRLDRDNSGPGAPELGGIQNTISLTEEDLRQLTALNAQAIRLQQKISGK